MIYLVLYLLIGCVDFLWTAISCLRYSDKEVNQIILDSNREYYYFVRMLVDNHVYWIIHGIVNITLWPIILILRIRKRWLEKTKRNGEL